MNKEQELKKQLKIIRDNKGNLGENARVVSYRYLEGKLEGYQEAREEFKKEKDKWIEERGRMAKLLFKKGVKNW